MIKVGDYYVLFDFNDVMKTIEIKSVKVHGEQLLSVIDLQGTLYEIIPPSKYPAIYTVTDGGTFTELDKDKAKEVYENTLNEIKTFDDKLKRLEKLKEAISKKYFGTV